MKSLGRASHIPLCRFSLFRPSIILCERPPHSFMSTRMNDLFQSFAASSLSFIEKITFESEVEPSFPNKEKEETILPKLGKSYGHRDYTLETTKKFHTTTQCLENGQQQTLSSFRNIIINSTKDGDVSGNLRKPKKVTIVGAGSVGMACAQTILTQHLCEEMALVDMSREKVMGELMDLKHASAFLDRVNLVGSNAYDITHGSDICIVTAGQRQEEGESRLSLVNRNTQLLKKIIPSLIHHSPDTILLMVTNPVDILTYVAWKISGLPAHKVIGSGTNLDSSRLQTLIADSLGVNAQSVHSYIIGEHGDSSVPVWSGVSISGLPLVEFVRSRGIDLGEGELNRLHHEVVNAAYEVIRLKGYTNWAVGYSVASIVKAIMSDQKTIHPLSTNAKGFYQQKSDVFLSLPCLLGSSGIEGTVEQVLTPNEQEQLQKSAKALQSVLKFIKF